MRLVLATNHLGLGGSESYLLTVAEQLDRLAHDVVVYAPEPAGGVAVAEERGIRVVDESGLEGDFDAALVQDPGVSYRIADRCPGVPQLFVAHSAKFDLQALPQLDGAVQMAVALNDRVARRLRSYATEVEVVRLRQPIDTEWFAPRGALPEVAGHALLLSNAPGEDRLAMLESACAEAGLELARLGGLSGHASDVRPALAGAEIVIGYGRAILEGMSMGRAAYVYDWNGGDGWMTPQSYAAIEADGIAGGSEETLDADRLAADLRGYEASMGPVNRDLVVAHHRANVHAEQLVELLQRLDPPPPPPRAPLEEMARLVRLEWRTRVDVHSLASENAHLRGLLTEADRSAREGWKRVGEQERRVAETAREHVEAYESTLSWRLTRPLRRLAGAIRRLRARRAAR